MGAAAFAGLRPTLCWGAIQAQMDFILSPDHTEDDMSELAWQTCTAAPSGARIMKAKGEQSQAQPSLTGRQSLLAAM